MGLKERLESWGVLPTPEPEEIERYGGDLDFLSAYSWWPNGMNFTQPGVPQEEIAATFAGYVRGAYQSSGLIMALMTARASLFSEARFQWRTFRNGRPGPLFGNEALAPLENPWQNAKTGDLLVRLMQDYDLTGNFFGWRTGDRILRLRPDWVTIVLGSNMDVEEVGNAIDAQPIGYIYKPGGYGGKDEEIILRAEEVCHFTGPTPDPTARFRGQSWLSSILAELQADKSMTAHKQKFFENGATPNLAITLDLSDPDRFSKWQEKIKSNFEGTGNAYKTMILGAGATVQPVGTNIQQLDFKVVQGAGETRIASAAGVPSIIVGFSEGQEAATYSNYQQAMLRFSRLTMSPLWRMAAGCFESILEVPSGAELWYDTRDIPALQDNITDKAEVQAKQAAAAKLYVDGGWEPDSIVDAINSDDVTRLVHSGLPTVQLQQAAVAAPTNGDVPAIEPPPSARAEIIRELEERVK